MSYTSRSCLISKSKFRNLENLDNFFYKEVNIGKKLYFCETTLIQGLTDGLKPEFKNNIIVNFPNNTTEWYRIFKQFVKVSIL